MPESISTTHRLPAGTEDVIRTEFTVDDVYYHRTHVDKVVYLNGSLQSINLAASFHEVCFLADGTWDYEALDALVEYLTKQRKLLDAL